MKRESVTNAPFARYTNMRRPKRMPWLVITVFLTGIFICAVSGAFPSREQQAEEAVQLGDADALLRLVREGLDPKTEVCTQVTMPDWTAAFPFRLFPSNIFPTVCAVKSPVLVEAVRNAKGEIAQNTVAELLRRGADCNATSSAGDSPLFVAVRAGNVEMAAFLLSHGASVNTNDARNAFYEALFMDSAPIVRLMLARGQSTHERFDFDNDKTPLMVAAQYGSVNSVVILLEKKSAPNAQDNEGDTALSMALGSCYNFDSDKKRIPNLLLRHGASLFIKNHDGAMPFDRLSSTQDVYKATGQTGKIPQILSGPPPL